MTNPTSNFGWQMPTPTDLVTDLPADFEVFGQAVDTSMADLKGGTTGQILSKATNADMDFTWITNDVGDITAVTVSSPLTGGGTSGNVSVGILSGTTSNLGAVQLSDSTSSTSTTLAATANAVKTTYDLANAAIAKSTVTTAGDIIYRNVSAPTRLGIGTAGQVLTVNSGATAPEWATPASGANSFYAGKNKVINGNFGVWQRGTTFTNIGAGSYCADRFVEAHDGSGLTTVTQQTFTPGTAPVAGYEGTYFLRDTLTSVGSSTYIAITQSIEDVRVFAGQTVTLSFWAKADSARTSIVYLEQKFGSGGSSSVFTSTPSITYSTAWQRFSFTISVPSISGKTIGTGSSLMLGIRSTATAGSVLDIWGVQLEAGSTATDFQTASGSVAGELALCQRYYFRNGAGIAYGSYGVGIANSTTIVYGQIFLPVTMRTAPTAIDYSTLGVYDSVTPTAVTSASIGAGIASSPNVAQISLVVASGLTQYRPYQITNINSTSGYIGFSAEL